MVKSVNNTGGQLSDLSSEAILRAFGLGQTAPESYSPLTLAYLGDCVYEVIVRSLIVGEGNTSPNRLNKRASDLSKAPAQSLLAGIIKEQLTPEEEAVYRRGRNAKSATTAKNATVSDYRRATGLEALCGYLFLKGDTDRLLELLAAGITGIRALNAKNV